MQKLRFPPLRINAELSKTLSFQARGWLEYSLTCYKANKKKHDLLCGAVNAEIEAPTAENYCRAIRDSLFKQDVSQNIILHASTARDSAVLISALSVHSP